MNTFENWLKVFFHLKAYRAAFEAYKAEWERDRTEHDKRDLAAKIARQFHGVETWCFIFYINSQVESGNMPKEMKK